MINKITPTAMITFRKIESDSLIRMHRDNRMYEWATIGHVPVGTE